MTKIEFSQATGLSGDLKTELETAANNIFDAYKVNLTQKIGQVVDDGLRARNTFSDVHPLIRKLPGQQRIRNDDPSWRSFKSNLTKYLKTGEQYEPINEVSLRATDDFYLEVLRSTLSAEEKEKVNMEFESQVAEMKSTDCPQIYTTFNTQQAALEAQYSSLFTDGSLHPEFNYEVAQALGLYVNRPTKEDFDTATKSYAATLQQIARMDFPSDHKERLVEQTFTLARHASQYRNLNRDTSHDWKPPSRPDTPL